MTDIQLKEQKIAHSTPGESSATPPDVLSISVFGGMSLAFRGQDIRIKSRKSRAVLAFLALNEHQHETRERLVGLFWSESEEHKARASLRQTLRELRQALSEAGYHGLQTEKLAIELDPKLVEVDLWITIHEAERHRAHPLLLNAVRAAESLLAGLEDIDPAFRGWLLAKRQTFQDRLLRGLETGLASDSTEPRERKLLAEAIINLDPTHEEACRALMQARAEEGDVVGRAARLQGAVGPARRRIRHGAVDRTQQLVAEIKQGNIEVRAAPLAPPPDGAAEPSAARSAGRRSKTALLMNPFDMNGVGADKIHLVHGFRHHLIACLVRFREWTVADNTAHVAPTAGTAGHLGGLQRGRDRLSDDGQGERRSDTAGEHHRASTSGARASSSNSKAGSKRSSASCGASRSRSTYSFRWSG